MDIVKKNIVAVICGGLVIIAVIALFVPLGGFNTKLQTELNTRKNDFTKAQNLLKTQRSLPVIELNKERGKLTSFPSPKAIAEGNRAKDLVHLASAKMLEQAVNLNRRELLMPGILPNPGDKIFDFRTAYLKAVQVDLPAFIGGAIPPTAEEIADQQKQLHDNEFEKRVIKVGGNEINREEIEREFKIAADELPERLRQDRATQFRLYLDRTALSVNPVMLDSSRKPSVTDLWFAQLSLWIEQDVLIALAEANNKGAAPASAKDRPNILSDPIKRLVRLDIAQDQNVYVMNAPGGIQSGTNAPPPADTSGSGRDYAVSPTGRYCNSIYDVTHFTLVLHVDYRQVPLILAELERNKLLTVTQSDIVPVDSAAQFDDGYVYGNAPMVELTLQCEALFMRDWTEKLMPPEIKALLRVTPPDGAAATR